MTTQINVQLKQKEKSAQRLWIGFILIFFILQAILWTSAIRLTANDRSHAVHPDYGQKALHWDQQVAQQQASDRLHWAATITVQNSPQANMPPTITLSIQDDQAQPIAGATVQLSAFDRARASQRFSIQLKPSPAGVYTALMPTTDRLGCWQFEGTATQGDSVFIIHQQLCLGEN